MGDTNLLKITVLSVVFVLVISCVTPCMAIRKPIENNQQTESKLSGDALSTQYLRSLFSLKVNARNTLGNDNDLSISNAKLATAIAPEEEWNRTFGGPEEDSAFSVQQTADGGYIIAGRTDSFGAGSTDVWLVKTAANGTEEWNRTFGGSSYEEGYSVQQTTDGGYIVAGVTESFGAGSWDVWLIKTNSNGYKQWDRTFGGPEAEIARSVQQTADGGYVVAGGKTFSLADPYIKSDTDLLLIKTDSTGTEQWSRTFGSFRGCIDSAHSVQQTTDGGYIVAGITQVRIFDIWLIKTNSTGTEQWSRTFGESLHHDGAYSVQQTTDGGYIVLGYTNSLGTGPCVVRLIKTDSNGILQMDKSFGNTLGDFGNSVQQTTDGGYIVAGWTHSYGVGLSDAWLIKTDATGNEQWNRTFGGTSNDYAYEGQQTADGGYILAGYTCSYGAGMADFWLVKVKKVTTSEFEVDTFISLNGILDKRSEKEYFIGNQLEVHAHVYNSTTGSITGCTVTGELWQNETVYHKFELFDDGQSTHADVHSDDGIYSSKIIVHPLKPENCTLKISATKDGLEGYDELLFENLGYPDGALNVTLSIIDTTPPDLFEGDIVVLQANVTDINGTSYLNATVNATVILPTFEQQNVGMAHVGNGTYQCSYVPEIGGGYIVDVFASVNVTDNSGLCGGYAEKKMDVLNGSLNLSCSPIMGCLVGEKINLSVNCSSNSEPVDGCLVEAAIEGINVSDTVFLHGSDVKGNYIGTYILSKNGSYTVQCNATHPFYKRANCSTSFEVFAGPPVELNDTLHSFASDSKQCLNDILREMDQSTREGDDFLNFKSKHEAQLAMMVVFDIMLPFLSQKLESIDEIVHAFEYLDQSTAEAYVMWWAAEKLFKKPIGEEITRAFLLKAVNDGSFRGYYTFQQEATSGYKGAIDNTVNSINLPPMDVSKQEKFIRDIQMRDHANNVLVTKSIMDGLPLRGLHTKRVVEAQKEWYQGVIDTLFWTTGLIIFCGIGDGPGLFFVICYGACTAGKIWDKMLTLDEDQKVISLTGSLMVTYPAASWQIYKNTINGIGQVDGEPRVPLGEIVSIKQVSQGKRILSWWSEDKGYFDVKVKNTGEIETFFKVVAIYWDENGEAHWQDATTKDSRGNLVGIGSTETFNIYWHHETFDIRPKIGDNVLVLLFAYPIGGIYVLDTKSFDFKPAERDIDASSTLKSTTYKLDDDNGLVFSNPITVFATTELNSTNYTVVVDLRNPLPIAIAADINQRIADNATLISCEGSIDNGTMQWYRQIPPHDHIRVNYTLQPIGEPGENITIPSAILSFYSPQHNANASFTSHSTNITVKPQLYGYASANRYVHPNVTNYVNVSLTNFGQNDIETNISIKLTDTNNTLKFNKSYNVTIPAQSTQDYNLTFIPQLDYEPLVMEIETYYNGYKIPLIRGCVFVAPFRTHNVGVSSFVMIEDSRNLGAFLPDGYDCNDSIVLTVEIIDLTPENQTDDAYSDITIQVDDFDVATCKVFKAGVGFLPEVSDITALPTIDGNPALSRDVVNKTVTIRIYVGDPLIGVIPAVESLIFDTGEGDYPSIAGTLNGTIKPLHDINVSKMYTYFCPGTGGHTEYVKLWNSTGWNATATWNGYQGDWHNITFNESFVLYKDETYNFTIKTGSYPQIIHESPFNATGGTIRCTSFEDANGEVHTDWIPAIRLE